jgi:hypothetical protein
MSSPATNVVPGDTLTLTITGKVADPANAGTPHGTTLKIFRPAGPSLYTVDQPAAVRVDAVLGPDAKIEYSVKSRFRNGVHIDADGRYWMRRPDGWHEMTVAGSAVPNALGSQFAPRDVQRLKEDTNT